MSYSYFENRRRYCSNLINIILRLYFSLKIYHASLKLTHFFNFRIVVESIWLNNSDVFYDGYCLIWAAIYIKLDCHLTPKRLKLHSLWRINYNYYSTLVHVWIYPQFEVICFFSILSIFNVSVNSFHRSLILMDSL